ncbi:hypothetical protein LIER_43794 [Lithospermum erythrorhizon]|uniref:Uncharacterized protein n=1 Tax=Lithospermum erythrorhizon TaxID=34254 RepID=A0AAV3QUG6_LITER
MSPPGKDGTMHVGDAQEKIKSDKGNSAPRLPDARNIEGVNFVAGLNQSGPSFEQVLESNIRKSIEEYEFQSFHGEIQFLETKQKNLLELSEMGMPITLEENKTFPHSSRDDVIENHDHLSPDASGIPLTQICGSGFQKKGTSLSSCKSSVQAMDTENVACTSFSEVNSNQFIFGLLQSYVN